MDRLLCGSRSANRLQPRFFPEDQATGLASSVCRAITTRVEMDGLTDSASTNRKHGIASLVGPLVDLELFAAELEHFCHERHAVKLSFSVQCCKDFFLAPNFDPVTDPQSSTLESQERTSLHATTTLYWPSPICSFNRFRILAASGPN